MWWEAALQLLFSDRPKQARSVAQQLLGGIVAEYCPPEGSVIKTKGIVGLHLKSALEYCQFLSVHALCTDAVQMISFDNFLLSVMQMSDLLRDPECNC